MLVSATAGRLAFAILFAATSVAMSDPPGPPKPPVDEGGIKVNSIDDKTPAATDCVADSTCKKAHTQGGSTQPDPAGDKAPPGD